MIKSNLEQYKNLEDVVQSLEFLDHETLKRTLAYIIKIYIIDKGISYNGQVETSISAVDNIQPENQQLRSSTFNHLLAELKKTYSFPELDLFEVDETGTYIKLNGKRELLTNNKAADSLPERPVHSKIPNNIKQPGDNPTNGEQPARFKNLEMD
jgi:hypothetical protein